MQDPSEGVDRTTKEDDVKDGPSYTLSCLWRGVEKMEFAQKIRYHFRFSVVFLLAQGRYRCYFGNGLHD